jgi:hypothetical protein
MLVSLPRPTAITTHGSRASHIDVICCRLNRRGLHFYNQVDAIQGQESRVRHA